MTRMLDTLEADGLVERIADPGDRRSKHLRLTAVGEAVLEEIFGIVDDLRERLIAGLTPGEVDALNSTLVTLTGRLDDGLPPD
jgi:MarR family transcriptional regulator for hemolysin